MKYKILSKLDSTYHKLCLTKGSFWWYHLSFICDFYDYYIISSTGITDEELELMKIDDKLNRIAIRQEYINDKKKAPI